MNTKLYIPEQYSEKTCIDFAVYINTKITRCVLYFPTLFPLSFTQVTLIILHLPTVCPSLFQVQSLIYLRRTLITYNNTIINGNRLK